MLIFTHSYIEVDSFMYTHCAPSTPTAQNISCNFFSRYYKVELRYYIFYTAWGWIPVAVTRKFLV